MYEVNKIGEVTSETILTFKNAVFGEEQKGKKLRHMVTIFRAKHDL